MRRKTAERLISFGIIILVLGLFIYFFSIKVIHTDVDEIEGQRELSITSHYDKGERIEGYFTVRFGNEEIEFRIEDPYGIIVHDAGTVKGRHDFGLTTEHSGVYTLIFGNKEEHMKTVYRSRVVNVTARIDLIVVGIGIFIMLVGLVGLGPKLEEKFEKKIDQRTIARANLSRASNHSLLVTAK